MISTTHIHPMLVHFPVALVVFGFMAEVASLYFKKEVCLSRLGFYLLIFGTLSALSAAITGLLFTSEMAGAAGKIKETHELFASITVSLLIVTSILRIISQSRGKENKGLKRIAFVLYGLTAITVSITGFYGGTLVYSYMMSL